MSVSSQQRRQVNITKAARSTTRRARPLGMACNKPPKKPMLRTPVRRVGSVHSCRDAPALPGNSVARRRHTQAGGAGQRGAAVGGGLVVGRALRDEKTGAPPCAPRNCRYGRGVGRRVGRHGLLTSVGAGERIATAPTAQLPSSRSPGSPRAVRLAQPVPARLGSRLTSHPAEPAAAALTGRDQAAAGSYARDASGWWEGNVSCVRPGRLRCARLAAHMGCENATRGRGSI